MLYDKFAPVTISVCMIVRDEEAVIERCLKNVSQFADELIVVDTGSVDGTRDIACKYTDLVYDYAWQYDFAAARNFSFSKATCDYIMWLDADDDMDAETIGKIQDLKAHMPPDTDAVSFRYRQDGSGSDIGWELMRDRLIRRAINPTWHYPIHEYIMLDKNCRILSRPDICLVHRKVKQNEKRRNISIYEKKMQEGFELDPFNRSFYCVELCRDENYEEAAKQFDLVYESGEPASVSNALESYIYSMNELHRYEELKERLQHCLRDYGANEMMLCALGDVLRREKKNEEAIEMYRAALACQIDINDYMGHSSEYHDFFPWLGIGKAYLNMGEPQKARDALQRARAIHPDNAQLCVLLLLVERKVKSG